MQCAELDKSTALLSYVFTEDESQGKWLAKGLFNKKEWHEGINRVGQTDPYYVWLAEVKEDPSLDEINASIAAQRGF